MVVSMRFLPIFLDLSQRSVVLVGSGDMALNKLRLLLGANARVRWYPGSVDVAEEVAQLGAGALDLSFQDPTQADLSESLAVVCASGTPLDEAVAGRARALGIPVNVVDRADLSTFIFPAIVDRGEVVVAIGTSGSAPVLARRLRERIEAVLPARIGELAALIGRYRRRVAAAKTRLSPRRFWERIVDGPIGAAVLAGRTAQAETELNRAIRTATLGASSDVGTVHLVGAGPGDPDLLTLRALHALSDADVVFHDELVTDAVLDRARRDAERVFVGKRRGAPGIGQDEINRRIVAAARAGRKVVRLKGGDPLVFGRAGEELEVLRAAGVPAVVVPGITAALGCAAEIGLPLTFREEASRISIITAQRAKDAEAIDWSGVADRQTTLVVYMGLASAAAVRDGLIAAGRDAATPAAVLARGTRPDSQAVVGRLDELSELAGSVGAGPALLVVGDVVRHSETWHQQIDALCARLEQAA
jgi:uroporphyrin-III C-methyltransferase / precorrin-2 dehydrogenase / sirohydrochlorin ferrochelatase